MPKRMYAMQEYMCYVCMKNGKLLVCKMIKSNCGSFHPEKNGYKPAWHPNQNTDPKFLAAVQKLVEK